MDGDEAWKSAFQQALQVIPRFLLTPLCDSTITTFAFLDACYLWLYTQIYSVLMTILGVFNARFPYQGAGSEVEGKLPKIINRRGNLWKS